MFYIISTLKVVFIVILVVLMAIIILRIGTQMRLRKLKASIKVDGEK